MEDPELGAVVIVLEGFKGTQLGGEWKPGDAIEYPVTLLDAILAAFFK